MKSYREKETRGDLKLPPTPPMAFTLKSPLQKEDQLPRQSGFFLKGVRLQADTLTLLRQTGSALTPINPIKSKKINLQKGCPKHEL
jgi:hypothetical protein